jgi:uncharacterized protein YdeI (YjbR/CyaY-like superfamily)
MEVIENIEAFHPHNTEEWRIWLEQHGQIKKSVWLILYHKKSGVPTISYEEAIEHALCYGWIDSKAKSRDTLSSYLKFTPRGPKSSWGKRNRERAAGMIEKGMMREPGQKMIDLAKEKGKWEESENQQNKPNET